MNDNAPAAVDLSDKQILAKTKQINSPNGESMQLQYTLASGRTVKSEFFKKDQGAKALMAWCQVIRDQALVDAQDERDKVRQALMEQKAQAARAIVDKNGAALTAAQPLAAVPFAETADTTFPGSPSTIASPDQFVKDAIARSRADVANYEAQMYAVMTNLNNARANLQKWEALEKSLIPSVPAQAAPVLPPKRRGRPKKPKTVTVVTEGEANAD